MLLQDKVAIITGGGSGMGKAMCQLFSSQGAKVVVADLNAEAAEATRQELPGDALAVSVNVADEEMVSHLVDEAVRAFGRVDIVANNAGVPMSFLPIEELTVERWDTIMNVNTKSIFLTSKYVVPHMKKQGGGVIINTASIASIRARPGLHAYCASKGAAVILSKALAIELAPYKIRVNAINPGPADTPMLSKFMNGDQATIERETKEIFIDSVPLGSLISPEDIANAALYLASDMGKMVTGEVLNVDGGRGI